MKQNSVKGLTLPLDLCLEEVLIFAFKGMENHARQNLE